MWTPDHLRAMVGSSLNPGRTTLVGPILASHGEESLEAGWCFLAVCNYGFHFPESGFLKQIRDFHFCKPKMGIGIQITGLFEGVLEKIQNNNPAIWPEDPVDFLQSQERAGGVVKGLAEDGKID